jgi:hypothetical protein
MVITVKRKWILNTDQKLRDEIRREKIERNPERKIERNPERKIERNPERRKLNNCMKDVNVSAYQNMLVD